MPYSGRYGNLGLPGWPSDEAGHGEPCQGARTWLSLGVGGSPEEPSICSRSRARPQLDWEAAVALGRVGGVFWRARQHLFSLRLPNQKLHPHPSEWSDEPKAVRKAHAQNMTA